MYKDSVITEIEFNNYRLNRDLAKENLASAENAVQLIKDGVAKRSGRVSNRVTSTITGMVLEVPVKEGESVVERSGFNEGSTIATVADMSDMIFEGNVDESEVGKGMMPNRIMS